MYPGVLYSLNLFDEWKDLFAYDRFLDYRGLEKHDDIAVVGRYFSIVPFAYDCASYPSGQYEIVQSFPGF